MTDKKLNLWFFLFVGVFITGIIGTVFGVIDIATRHYLYNTYNIVSEDSMLLGFAFAASNMGIFIPLLFWFVFRWPFPHEEFYTIEEEDAFRQECLEMMKEKGFTFKEEENNHEN